MFTPGREQILRAILAHLPADRDEPFLIVEAGCGRGWPSEAVLRGLPGSRELAGDDRPYRIFVESKWNRYEHPDPADKPSGAAEQPRRLAEVGPSKG